MTQQSNEKDICCPEFDPIPWDGKVFEWKDKKFIKDSVFTIFYMPVNFGGVMRKLDKKVREANAEIPRLDGFVRSHFKMEYGYLPRCR
jgi:hypothetical protein